MLFAEADKQFIDFLKNQGTVGNFGNMYGIIENLSTTYLQPNLKHKIYIFETGGVPLLLPDIESTSITRKFYRCNIVVIVARLQQQL